MDAPILVLCRDLLFGSKITSTAGTAGVAVKMLRDPKKLAEEQGDRLIVDLTYEGFPQAAAEWKSRTGGHVTGFAGHTDVELIAAAQNAGMDLVLSRGEFSARLADVLKLNPPR